MAETMTPVDITRDDVLAVSGYGPDAIVETINARLRARAADVVPCRVVRRPVEEVSTIKTPKDCGVDGLIVVEVEGGDTTLTQTNNWLLFTTKAVRWCVPGQPWITRTTQPTAREWRTGDVPPVGTAVILYDADGEVYDDGGYTLIGSEQPADRIAAEWNRLGISAYLIAPAAVGASHG